MTTLQIFLTALVAIPVLGFASFVEMMAGDSNLFGMLGGVALLVAMGSGLILAFQFIAGLS